MGISLKRIESDNDVLVSFAFLYGISLKRIERAYDSWKDFISSDESH